MLIYSYTNNAFIDIDEYIKYPQSRISTVQCMKLFKEQMKEVF